MLIIGERLNSSRRVVLEALRKRDQDYLLKEAGAQRDAGAHYIDLNAAPAGDEIETLRWAVPLLQRELNVCLSIDSTNPAAIEAALDLHEATAIVNSVTGEEARLKHLLPLITRYKPLVIALCMDDRGIPGPLTRL